MNCELRKSTRDQRSKSVIKNSEKLTKNQTRSAGQTRTSEVASSAGQTHISEAEQQDKRNQTSPAGQTRTSEVASSAGQTRTSEMKHQDQRNQTSSAGQTRTSEMKNQDQRNQTSPAGQIRTSEVERPISPISSRPLSEDDRSISPISASNIDSFSKRYSHIRLPQSYSHEAESPRKKERPPSYGSKVDSQESQTGSGNNYELLLSGIRRQSSYTYRILILYGAKCLCVYYDFQYRK